MLAAISEGDAGPSWTEIFESRFGPRWDGIQSALDQVVGPVMFNVYIQPPPAGSAIISCHSNDGSEERFEIEPVRLLTHSSLANEPSSVDGIWEFYEFGVARKYM
ncbi:hypothetical protein N7522_013653 [Penicillium canescens]|uniref:Uncharacterized protein n=1 Tax=Penicillium canescens TaxID=5083 RepID=A0AAD6N5U1_PENCN|nr:uncharacterized protein N7446_009301 [Penicillium canescens]KAJ5981232.1 hypothetical protein N7522_013653 [Penicillium canescens]KAJ6034551.1 hypothetical protein N7460_008726 [Penicillium canescens]KAJ6046210.1 hypothetical protein N7444_007464 [Penicillium canescens]KAJ6053289.1 hypothetical protein N7446_009301 [Penicillium canescens]